MFKKFISLTILGLVISTIINEVESGVIGDAVSDFVDKTKCRLNAISNTIFNRKQEDHPCEVEHHNGPSQQENTVNGNSKFIFFDLQLSRIAVCSECISGIYLTNYLFIKTQN